MPQLNESSFEKQMDRIKCITDKRTYAELSSFFGIRQSAVSDAKRRRKIPSHWLLVLLRVKDVNPEWIVSGKGHCFMSLPSIEGGYELGESYAIKKDDEEALRRLSSRMLADELVRRVAILQDTELCSNQEE